MNNNFTDPAMRDTKGLDDVVSRADSPVQDEAERKLAQSLQEGLCGDPFGHLGPHPTVRAGQ